MRTETESSFWTEDEAEFVMSESTLLMLKDENLEKQLFRMSLGFPGKHLVSDREAVIEELKVQGKWIGEDQTGNETNKAETRKNTETVDKQQEKFDTTQKSKNIPFTSSFWVLAIVLGAVMYVRKIKQ